MPVKTYYGRSSLWIFTVSGRNTSSSETVKPSLVTIVQECGPSWICQNTSIEIMYGNNIVLYSYIVMLWGKRKTVSTLHSNLWTSWLMALHVFSSGASATHQSSDSLGSCQAGPSPPRWMDGTLVLESCKVETYIYIYKYIDPFNRKFPVFMF